MARIATTVLVVLAGTAHPLLAQAPRPPVERVIAGDAALETFHGVAISPEGKRVAWVESLPGKDGMPSDRTAVFVATLAAPGVLGEAMPAPRRLSAGGASSRDEAHESSPAWSPDGRHLAFLADGGGGGQLQLYVADLGPAGSGPGRPAGEPRKLTSLEGHLADPRWSPDGRAIALLVIEGRSGPGGPLAATARDAGVVGETPVEQRLAVVTVASGAARLVSPADLYVYEYAWSPDGRSFAATAAHGSGDDNWYVAELYWVQADGSAARSLLKPPYQIANPRFSPDGSRIAFIGGLMSDEGATGGDIYLLAAPGPAAAPAPEAAARDATPGLAASPAWFEWAAPDRIVFADNVDGDCGVAELELPAGGAGGGHVNSLWRGAELITLDGGSVGLSLARDGRSSALIKHSFSHPPEVWAGTVGSWRQLTFSNARFSPAWGEAASLHWQSDGVTVQGWLLAPAGISLESVRAEHAAGRGARLPLVVFVHGGPAGAHKPGWPTFAGALASQGFLVLLPNPRGSYGQGEEFTRGNVKDFGYGDLRDILGGVDAAVGSGAADGARTGIFGWSYGGYMVMWAVTQTDRFRAAVAGAGVSNWQSYYGENKIDQWLIPYFGASVYEDPYIYARSSPISYITRVKTPTLVLQGERDAEVPAPQSYEFWHALKTLGVETQLVIYPDEGHRFRRPEHLRDRATRVVDWLDKHLK